MIVKISLLGICVCVISIILKQYKSSYIILLNIAFAVTAIIIISENSADSIQQLKELFTVNSATGKAMICLYKAGIICILSKFAGDICKESGSQLVADIIELSGKIMLLVIALPYIESIIRTAATFIK